MGLDAMLDALVVVLGLVAAVRVVFVWLDFAGGVIPVPKLSLCWPQAATLVAVLRVASTDVLVIKRTEFEGNVI